MSWYPIEPTDAGIFDTAPLIYRFPIRLAVPPRRVWESLTSQDSLADWGPGVKAVNWLTARPFGIGTEREVVIIGGAARTHERFFRWDDSPGILGYSFFAHEATVPVFRQFAENYVLEPDGAGTLLTWTVAIEPKPRFAVAMKALGFVNRIAFGSTARDCRKYFAAHPSSG